MTSQQRVSTATTTPEVRIESFSHEGRGIARIDGKAVFVHGALPGETVRIRYTRRRRSFDEASTTEVLVRSPERAEPICRHYDVCGGCSLQHLSTDVQLRHKESVLLEHLRHAGGGEPEQVLAPLRGPDRAYRSKARLSVKYLAGKGRALVGFRERRSNFVAEIDACPVLDPRLSDLLPELACVIGELSVRNAVPQIEAAAGQEGCALIFRHMRPLTSEDTARLVVFAERHGVTVLLQPGAEDSIHALDGKSVEALSYRLDEYDLDIGFGPAEFTQVNFDMNRIMIRQVMGLLAPQPDEPVLDLFCGVGNFSLPLARHAANVLGVDGSDALVQRARENARRNGFANVEFLTADLEGCDPHAAFFRRGHRKVLLDPPRTGARHIVSHMPLEGVAAIAYVSCNPATFARDAAILVRERGFTLSRAGVMDMFPHTSHVESLALFTRA